MRFFLSQLGCKLNLAELEAISRQLVADGHRIVSRLEEADVHIVNSCTVTHLAARDSRKVARRGSRITPRRGRPLRTVLTGCYATASQTEARALTGVDLVIANQDKDELLEILYQSFPEIRPVERPQTPVFHAPLDFGHARASIKIEDGCNMRCSFCIIPSTRGRQQSRPSELVVEELRRLVELGYREVVITGVQISAYRSQRMRLADLVEHLLEETRVERLRLTSIAPWQFDRRLLELFPSRRLCRHFHLSLQSGCDRTLKRMRRPYDSATYRRLVADIRDHIPGVAITTDVIVGFPEETEEDFERSLGFVKSMGFALCHVFPYSQRAGTSAAELPDTVPHATKKTRVQAMIDAARRGQQAFREQQIGSTQQVLWEDVGPTRWRGTTDNYVPALVPEDGSPQPRRGRISPVMLVSIQPSGVEAKRV
jgi:threonylcarbamoyladenosine tRNA methylthiotransferase MtaB